MIFTDPHSWRQDVFHDKDGTSALQISLLDSTLFFFFAKAYMDFRKSRRMNVLALPFRRDLLRLQRHLLDLMLAYQGFHSFSY